MNKRIVVIAIFSIFVLACPEDEASEKTEATDAAVAMDAAKVDAKVKPECGEDEHYSEEQNSCVECFSDDHCGEPYVCDVGINECVQCTTNSHCDYFTVSRVCSDNQCINCLTDADCVVLGIDPPYNVCIGQKCRGCRVDGDCGYKAEECGRASAYTAIPYCRGDNECACRQVTTPI